jgi:MFS family permease
MSNPFATASMSNEITAEKKHARIAAALAFFYMGLCFASWASRIPDIKTYLHLSDGQLGSILFAIPVGQLLMMTFSGKLVTRYGSRKIMTIALPLYVVCINLIGWATAGWQLAIVLFCFGLTGNLNNISINTQAVGVEHLYNRPILATFHGGWSLAGFTGALTGFLMINLKIAPKWHFLVITLIALTILWRIRPYLLECKPAVDQNAPKRKLFNKPDGLLVQLGIIAFCSMASEGAMFDWSGVYFKDVVKAPASLVVLGYTSFMIMMATGRFLADKVIQKIGRKKLLQTAGIVISTGLFTAVLFPYLIPCTLAFMIIGLGVSGNIPTVYSAAGRHKAVPTGIALATVSGIGFLGFLMGPPLIGYISEMFSLRYSFAMIGLFGIGISLLVSRIKALEVIQPSAPRMEETEESVTSFGELP